MLAPLLISQTAFQRPKWMVPTSGWLEHAPFAFWLIEAHRPQCVVELGTHHGFSYLCFCQKVQELSLEAKCFAVDTWKGDEHSGLYDEEIFDNLRRYHDAHYCNFSHLVRSTFDEAVSQFADGSIDLLHIDGRHLYEDAKHDFQTWQSKLSSRAVVLFHDTQVKNLGFGVFRFWESISENFPHFEFLHGHGLGVLGVGCDNSVSTLPIFKSNNEADVVSIRLAYERLGAAVSGRKPFSRNELCVCGSGNKFKHCHGKYE